jgi:hypothetical protein
VDFSFSLPFCLRQFESSGPGCHNRAHGKCSCKAQVVNVVHEKKKLGNFLYLIFGGGLMSVWHVMKNKNAMILYSLPLRKG